MQVHDKALTVAGVTILSVGLLAGGIATVANETEDAPSSERLELGGVLGEPGETSETAADASSGSPETGSTADGGAEGTGESSTEADQPAEPEVIPEDPAPVVVPPAAPSPVVAKSEKPSGVAAASFRVGVEKQTPAECATKDGAMERRFGEKTPSDAVSAAASRAAFVAAYDASRAKFLAAAAAAAAPSEQGRAQTQNPSKVQSWQQAPGVEPERGATAVERGDDSRGGWGSHSGSRHSEHSNQYQQSDRHEWGGSHRSSGGRH